MRGSAGIQLGFKTIVFAKSVQKMLVFVPYRAFIGRDSYNETQNL